MGLLGLLLEQLDCLAERVFVRFARGEHQAPALGSAKQRFPCVEGGEGMINFIFFFVVFIRFACVEGGEGVLQGAGAVEVECALYYCAQLQVAGIQQRARLQHAERAVVVVPLSGFVFHQTSTEVEVKSAEADVATQELTLLLRPAEPRACRVQGFHEIVGQSVDQRTVGGRMLQQEKPPPMAFQVFELSAGGGRLSLGVLLLLFSHWLPHRLRGRACGQTRESGSRLG